MSTTMRRIGAAALAAPLAVAAWAWAPRAAEAQTMTFGVETTQYFPHYDNDNGHYGGYAAEVLNLYAKSRGIVPAYDLAPIKRLYQNFFSGKVDFKYPDNPLWQADQRAGLTIHYSEPVADYIDGCMVTPERLGMGSDAVKKLGTVRGFTPWEYRGRIEAKAIEVSENDSFKGLLQQLLIGRVDCAYINVSVAKYQLREVLKKPDAAVFDPGLPHSRDSYRLSSINHPQRIQEFNAFLVEHKATLDELKARYGVLLE